MRIQLFLLLGGLLVSPLASGQQRHAIVFDGFNDFVLVEDNDALDFGNEDFTVSAWIKTSDTPSGSDYPIIISKEPGSGARFGYVLFIDPTSVGIGKKAGFLVSSNGQFVLATSTTSINDGDWHHIAGVKTGNGIEIIIDGVSEDTQAHNLGTLSNELPLTFGRAAANTPWYFNGLISEGRIWSYARTAGEILADMNEPLTGTETNLVAYWPMDEGKGQTTADLAGNNSGQLGSTVQTDINDPLWTLNVFPHSLARGNALLFDGLNDWVSVANSGDIDFDTEDFTVSVWIKTLQAPSTSIWSIIVGKESGVGTSRTGFDIVLQTPPYQGLVDFEIWSGGAVAGVGSHTPLNDGQWHHIAGVKSSTQVELFVDGVSQGTAPYTLGSVSTSEPLHFGSASHPKQWYYQGLMDEVRIWSSARTQQQIQAEMSHELSGTEDTLVGYWKFEESEGQTTADSAGTNDGLLGSSAAWDINDPIWLHTNFPVTIFKDNFESPLAATFFLLR
jgi:hypothetical protein